MLKEKHNKTLDIINETQKDFNDLNTDNGCEKDPLFDDSEEIMNETQKDFNDLNTDNGCEKDPLFDDSEEIEK